VHKKAAFSDAEWEARASGEKLAADGRPMRVPPRLTQAEQVAFREGFHIKKEDLRNRAIVAEMRTMLGGKRLLSVLQSLVKH
jgi:hypothetical protein